MSDLLNKAYGCLMGVALGDAMGMPSSLWTPRQIKERFGRIEGFLPGPADHPIHAGLRAGQVTDDTQQTLCLAKAIIERGAVVAEAVAAALVQWAIDNRALETDLLGPSSKRALSLLLQGVPCQQAGQYGDTNGAAMRISPIGIIHPGDIPGVVADTEIACLPTHGTSLAISGAAAIACAIASCLGGEGSVDGVVAASKEGAILGRERGREVPGPAIDKRIDWAVRIARRGSSPGEAYADLYDYIGATVAIAETVPAALGLFVLAEGDPLKTVLYAANMGGDCDTIGAIAGGIAGAFTGVGAFPGEYIELIEEVNNLNLRQLAQQLLALTT
ncbi:MAG: ADP-ribosylglycohydrolase family protein [Chloroflexi bacterium]|nr:ADP-ribosylglycohydrolase family protein [Chloroflexota bacterium]